MFLINLNAATSGFEITNNTRDEGNLSFSFPDISTSLVLNCHLFHRRSGKQTRVVFLTETTIHL